MCYKFQNACLIVCNLWYRTAWHSITWASATNEGGALRVTLLRLPRCTRWQVNGVTPGLNAVLHHYMPADWEVSHKHVYDYNIYF